MFPLLTDSPDIKKYLKSLISKNDPSRHQNYEASVEHAEQMDVHIFGDEPTAILEASRPRESAETRQYRLESFEPVSKSKSQQVISIIKNIFNDDLYSIDFNRDSELSMDFEEYVRDKFPHYKDIMRYSDNVLLKQSLADPNAVMLIIPQNLEAEETERYEPIPIIFCSEQVLDQKQGEYFVLLDSNTHTFKSKNATHEGAIIHVVDDVSITTYIQTDVGDDPKFTLRREFIHGINAIPAFRLGGTIEGKGIPYIFRSFIEGIVPHWNKWIRYESDITGSLTMHIYPQKWEMEQDCPDCSGSGVIQMKGKDLQLHDGECSKCSGSGKCGSNEGMFDIVTVKQEAFTSDVPPITPPGGYMEMSSAISAVEALKKERDESIIQGLASINMDILSKIGEIQSGVAKTIDRQPLHNKLFEIGTHTFDFQIKYMLNIINRYRYIVDLGGDIDENMPIIQKPIDFDILTAQELTAEVAIMTQANVDPNMITAVEKDMIKKRFPTDKLTQQFLKNIKVLDPLPNKTTDQKFTAFQNGIITKENWVISENINEMLKEALNEDEDFFTLPYDEKIEAIKKTDTFIKTMGDDLNEQEDGMLERNDVEAEAKAKLKGTVGGVQGIIAINQSVSRGEMTEQSAERMLMEIYGFNEETANALIEKTNGTRGVEQRIISGDFPDGGGAE